MSARGKTAEMLQQAVAEKVVGLVIDGIVLAALIVLGMLNGSFSVVSEFAAIHPGECALWCAAFLFGGAFLGLLASRLLEFGKRARRIDYLRRSFAFMPPRRKAIVAVALHDGVVSLPELDTDAAALCHLGVLGAPPFGFRLSNVDYSIQPAIADVMMKHGVEWTGDMDIETARQIISGKVGSSRCI